MKITKCIDADALQTAIKELDSGGDYTVYHFLEMIDKMPGADVEPVRHGKVIWKRRTKGGFKRYTGLDDMGEMCTITVDERCETEVAYCSECGKKLDDTFMNFCPNCGVDLNGGGEE